MTKEELIEKMEAVDKNYDPECGHADHDELLLEYINDPRVTEIFNRSTKWYA